MASRWVVVVAVVFFALVFLVSQVVFSILAFSRDSPDGSTRLPALEAQWAYQRESGFKLESHQRKRRDPLTAAALDLVGDLPVCDDLAA